MRPIDSFHNKSARITRSVTFRPLPQSGISQFGLWIQQHTFENVYNAGNTHEQAEILQTEMIGNLLSLIHI